jgi:hypothetical protein
LHRKKGARVAHEDFYFSLFSAAEPKQVIRALRSKSSCLPRSSAPQRPSAIERSLVENSPWKLPPNVYRLRDHFAEVSARQMGKSGPYQCFTVERDARTVGNHHASKPLEDVVDIFYDPPFGISETMLKSCNRYKSRFLRGERFGRRIRHQSVPPTRYFPQNFVMRPRADGKSSEPMKKPLFYYPNTTVPVKEMKFNKERFFKPPPGRYEPHDTICKCFLTEKRVRCPANVAGHGHCYVFNSKVFRLVDPVKVARRRRVSEPYMDAFLPRRRPSRDPISFRVRRSLSFDESMQSRQREIRFNTMVTRRKLFSVKTGRPVAFLAAMPRFEEPAKVAVDPEKAQKEKSKEKKAHRKPMTKKRLGELASPKDPLPRVSRKAKTVKDEIEEVPVTASEDPAEPSPPATSSLI